MNTTHNTPGSERERPVNATPTYPEHFNPSPDSAGFDLYEHWETIGPDEYALLAVAATPLAFDALQPGDWYLKRRWAPAGEPVVYNRARPTAGRNDQ